MRLVDTSVWVDFLRGTHTAKTEKLRALLEAAAPALITGVVLQELLQGARDAAEWKSLRTYFLALPFVHLEDPIVSHASAAELHYRCRRRGVTPRSMVDCLIAQVAIENGLVLLHDDADYDRMAKVIPELKVE